MIRLQQAEDEIDGLSVVRGIIYSVGLSAGAYLTAVLGAVWGGWL